MRIEARVTTEVLPGCAVTFDSVTLHKIVFEANDTGKTANLTHCGLFWRCNFGERYSPAGYGRSKAAGPRWAHARSHIVGSLFSRVASRRALIISALFLFALIPCFFARPWSALYVKLWRSVSIATGQRTRLQAQEASAIGAIQCNFLGKGALPRSYSKPTNTCCAPYLPVAVHGRRHIPIGSYTGRTPTGRHACIAVGSSYPTVCSYGT